MSRDPLAASVFNTSLSYVIMWSNHTIINTPISFICTPAYYMCAIPLKCRIHLLSLHSTISNLVMDGQPYFFFILVHIGCINMAKSSIYSSFGDLCNHTLRNLAKQPEGVSWDPCDWINSETASYFTKPQVSAVLNEFCLGGVEFSQVCLALFLSHNENSASEPRLQTETLMNHCHTRPSGTPPGSVICWEDPRDSVYSCNSGCYL